MYVLYSLKLCEIVRTVYSRTPFRSQQQKQLLKLMDHLTSLQHLAKLADAWLYLSQWNHFCHFSCILKLCGSVARSAALMNEAQVQFVLRRLRNTWSFTTTPTIRLVYGDRVAVLCFSTDLSIIIVQNKGYLKSYIEIVKHEGKTCKHHVTCFLCGPFQGCCLATTTIGKKLFILYTTMVNSVSM
jgi:hypothetical protein